MKKTLFFLLIVSSFVAQAQQKQSLKDLLYSGKLKSDSGTVIRKSDDLSTKIDTSTKKAPEPQKQAATTVATDPLRLKSPNANTATLVITDAAKDNAVAPPRSNSKVWKSYTDSLLASLKAEVLTSKKIKKGDYFMTVDYEIGTDGVASVTNVTSDPANPLLEDQVKERMNSAPPQFAPVLDSNNKPHKVKKRQSFTITKD